MNWISIKDRLPENNILVLTYSQGGNTVDLGYYHGKWAGGWTIGLSSGVNVTHWMPLPDPPKEAA